MGWKRYFNGRLKGVYFMKTVIQRITEIFGAAFSECGYDSNFGRVVVSGRPDLCQFQCNGAMVCAKEYKKSPMQIANEVMNKIESELFECLEIAPPGFINITLKDFAITEFIKEMSKDKDFGIAKDKENRTVVLDYGGPNVAKPLHVGHLRSAIIGESVKRLAKSLGYNAIGDIHLGDWGLQMGLIITEYAKDHPDSVYLNENFEGEYPQVDITIEELNDIYPRASKKSKEDEEYMALAQQATFDLQNGRRGYTAFWKEIMRISVSDLKKSYEKLNVDFEYWYGESDSEKYIPDMVKRFTDDGFAYESEGALVIDVQKDDDKAPMPPVIIRKRNGSQIYATTDLATLVQRMRDFNPKIILYFTDSRQGLHFEQVFRAARKTGIVPADVTLEFDGFGTMNGKDGKPYKTRDGGVMKLSDLIDMVCNSALKKMEEAKTGMELDEKEKKETALKVGIAALKFGDLINYRAKDYIFDLDKFLSFEGKTGPYLLYTMVRLNSILKKAKEKGFNIGEFGIPVTSVEKDLMLKILTTNEVLWQSFNDRAPNGVCENAYQIASLVNRFYYENKILSEENADRRGNLLALTEFALKALKMHTEILAIDVPERM